MLLVNMTTVRYPTRCGLVCGPFHRSNVTFVGRPGGIWATTGAFVAARSDVQVHKSRDACCSQRTEKAETTADVEALGPGLERVSQVPLLFLLFVRCAGAGGAEEQFAAIREGDVAAVGAIRSVLGLVTVHDHGCARGHGTLREAAAQENVRAACLEH